MKRYRTLGTCDTDREFHMQGEDCKGTWIPRRNRLDLITPAERAIYDAVQAVEQAGGSVLLTEAVVLLGQARDKVADHIEDSTETYTHGLATLDRMQPFTGCGICGGKLVMIRGRYPKTPQREVCPTCVQERLEQIQDISRPEYGQAAQAK